MAASDHLRPEQLRMFMTGKEIKDYAIPGDFPGGGGRIVGPEGRRTREQGWANKLEEAETGHLAGLAQSIRKEGVQEPVSISHRVYGPMLVNGHHRVAVASQMNQYVPVEHSQLEPPPKFVPPKNMNDEPM